MQEENKFYLSTEGYYFTFEQESSYYTCKLFSEESGEHLDSYGAQGIFDFFKVNNYFEAQITLGKY